MLKAVMLSVVISTGQPAFFKSGPIIEPIKAEVPKPAPEGRKKRPKNY